ncbi:MAG: CHAT domain-containing protein, partial [Pirellulales bacterium]
MLELGRQAVKEANHEAALRWLEEATYSGYYFKRPEVVLEAFELAHIVHMVQQSSDLDPLLARAARWANSHQLYELRSTLLTAVAESNAELGDPKRAVGSLSQASRAVRKFDIEHGIYGAQHARVAALIGYLVGDRQSADKSLMSALEFMRGGSIRLHHIDVADHAYTTGNIRDRVALDLYPQVLGDPSSFDWRFDPLESMALLVENRPAAMQNWFAAAMKRDDKVLALNVIDHMRSRRFGSTLPTLQLGGRLLNLRWILQADPSVLPPAAMIQRADLVGRFVRYNELQKEAQKVREELEKEELFPEKNPLAKQQAQRMQKLAEIADQQEIVLSRIAVSRVPAVTVFPPRNTDKSIQQRMRKGQVILCFHITPKKHHVFLLTYDRSGHWTIESPQDVRAKLTKLLRAMGNYDARRPLDAERLEDDSWREAARDLMAEITRGTKVDLGVGIDQLTIVPDGLYWYVPFEALPVGKEGEQLSLLEKTRVRYAPMLALTMPMGVGRRQADQYAIVAGNLARGQDERLTDDAVDGIRRHVARGHVVNRDSQFRGDVAATFLDGLVVMDDMDVIEKDPYQLAPMQVDKGKPGAALGEWLRLPWGGPQVAVFPGFHTPAENALKRLPNAERVGDEMFLTTMGLLATGTRTVLISRWRTAGRTANNLISEFLQELPNMPADDAWQRSVQVNQESPIDPEFEPRVEASDGIHAMASHPFFWSGYLLVDQGVDLPPEAGQAPPVKDGAP